MILLVRHVNLFIPTNLGLKTRSKGRIYRAGTLSTRHNVTDNPWDVHPTCSIPSFHIYPLINTRWVIFNHHGGDSQQIHRFQSCNAHTWQPLSKSQSLI